MAKPSLFSELISRKILTVEDNHLKVLDKVDISSYGSKAWAFTIQELSKKGKKDFLYNLGYTMGEDAAKEIIETVRKMQAFITNKLNELSNLIEITGFGIVNINFKNNNGVEVIVIKNHIIDLAKEMYGNKSEVCDFYKGIYTGFIDVYKNKKIKLKEVKCICKGGDKCIFSTENFE
jgi:predicted hydrocarbon binding protein